MCYKVSLRKKFQRQSCRYIILLTIHRWIASDVPKYLKFALKLTHPSGKRRFRQISHNSASVVRASEKVQLSLIESRQCALHRAIDEPCALPLSPPKGWLKTKFLHYALPLISSLQAIIDTSNLVCGLNIASPSLKITNRPWNGRGHVTWPIINF